MAVRRRLVRLRSVTCLEGLEAVWLLADARNQDGCVEHEVIKMTYTFKEICQRHPGHWQGIDIWSLGSA